jgi:hypothetical protein
MNHIILLFKINIIEIKYLIYYQLEYQVIVLKSNHYKKLHLNGK